MAGPYAFVTNETGGSVSVIELATNTVFATITGSLSQPRQVVVNADGTQLWVTDFATNLVWVYDGSLSVVTSIALSGVPSSMIMDPAGTFVYIVSGGTDLQRIDTTTFTLSTLVLTAGGLTAGITGDNVNIYVVADDGAHTATQIDVATFTIVTTFTGVFQLEHMTFNPFDGLLYLGSNFAPYNTITPVTNAVNTVPIGTRQYWQTVFNTAGGTPGTLAYVTVFSDGTVQLLDIPSYTLGPTIGGFSAPSGIAISPDGLFAYVVDQGANDVKVIDLSTDTITATIPVGTFPWDIAIQTLTPIPVVGWVLGHVEFG